MIGLSIPLFVKMLIVFQNTGRETTKEPHSMWGKKDERPAIVDVYRESGFPFKCQLTGIDEKDYQNIILNHSSATPFQCFKSEVKVKYLCVNLEKSLVRRGLLAPRNNALGIPEKGALKKES